MSQNSRSKATVTLRARGCAAILSVAGPAAILVASAALQARPAGAQEQPADAPIDSVAISDTVPPTPFPLPATRWVGIRQDVPTTGLWIEFYPDTMLLVNDVLLRNYVTSYRITDDSIIATGDTIFRVKYELVLERMLIYTAEGETITMSPQSTLARPFVGNWVGTLVTPDTTTSILLRIFANGTATWRHEGDGETHVGEWDRSARTFTFTWPLDSLTLDSLSADSALTDSTTTWVGFHDPEGNALQFPHTVEGSSITVFRKSFR